MKAFRARGLASISLLVAAFAVGCRDKAALPVPGHLGDACETGACDEGLGCYLDETGGLCSRPCKSDAECTGGVCAGGRCRPSCGADLECRRPFVCVMEGGRGWCGHLPEPPDLRAPEDLWHSPRDYQWVPPPEDMTMPRPDQFGGAGSPCLTSANCDLSACICNDGTAPPCVKGGICCDGYCERGVRCSANGHRCECDATTCWTCCSPPDINSGEWRCGPPPQDRYCNPGQGTSCFFCGSWMEGCIYGDGAPYCGCTFLPPFCSCNNGCTAVGGCHRGITDAFCGRGVACVACPMGQHCVNQQCQ